MEEAKKLIEHKNLIEAEIEEIQVSLKDPKYSRIFSLPLKLIFQNFCTTFDLVPLVDEEGFPLGDYETIKNKRLLKQRLEMLQNDHRELMERIKQTIENAHHVQKVSVTPAISKRHEYKVAEEFEEVPNPFAVVDSVFASSPAESAGIKVGDRLVQIGSLTRRTFVSLYDVADVLANSKGRPLTVIVNREANRKRVIKMELIPRLWNGNGLLGAHISVLNE